MADIKLDSKTARLKLPVRKKPYTNRIAPGIRLAYRRNESSGTWSVLGGGGRWLKRIGVADDLEPADGVNVLDYWQAQEHARDLARAKDAGSGKPITFAEALDAYSADLRARNADPYNAGRVLAHLPEALLSKTVAALNARELRRWRDGLLSKGLARSTVVRTCKTAKAALTAAADQDKRITNRDAWRVGLAGLPDANRTREDVILPDATVQRIVAAAHAEGSEFALLVEIAAVTGARPSQLRRLRVGDVQADRADPRLMMPSSLKGRRKGITRRPLPIPATLALRLRQIGAGRAAHAPLLLRGDGNAWRAGDQTRPFQRTVARVGLDPSEVTIYALRHSSITRSLLGNVPARVTAANHDTGLVQLEKTYSKFITDHSDAVTRKALLNLEQPVASNVRPLR